MAATLDDGEVKPSVLMPEERVRIRKASGKKYQGAAGFTEVMLENRK